MCRLDLLGGEDTIVSINFFIWVITVSMHESVFKPCLPEVAGGHAMRRRENRYIISLVVRCVRLSSVISLHGSVGILLVELSLGGGLNPFLQDETG